MTAAGERSRSHAVLHIGGTGYVAAMAMLAAWAAWPIYRSATFVLVALVGTFAATLIVAAAARWSWRPWLITVVTAGALLVLGVLLAVPSTLTGPPGVLGAVRDVLLGTVTGWKDLVTVQLPVGTYRNLLVPALVVMLIGSVIALRCAWAAPQHAGRAPGRAAVGAVAAAALMVMFGLGFGSPVVSVPVQLGPVLLIAPRESLVGLGALLLSVGFLAWRSAVTRAGALQRAAQRGGATLAPTRSGPAIRRSLLAGGMVVVTLGAALAVAPVAERLNREVLRSGIGPERELSAAISPLAQFRAYFTNASFGEVLFTVTAEGELPERVRLATLDAYDGKTFRAFGTGLGGDVSAPFTRVPSHLDPGPGAGAEVHIEIGEYDEIWMPLAGAVASVSFTGPRATALADAFYYNAEQRAAVQIAGGSLRAGDGYTLRVALPEARAVAALVPPATASTGTIVAPESLVTWMKEQDTGEGGPALAELVERLRARGSLSRALALPPDGEPAAWMAALGDVSFHPSAAGHSLARIDNLFRLLLEREAEVRAEGVEPTDDELVAATGDDEQFAVAIALMADALGFPARVVVGARLAATDDDTHCTAGVCRAGDLAAWAEVQDADGTWVPVDATPQHSTAPLRDSHELRDPEHATEVLPATAREVTPPAPTQHDAALPPDDDVGVPLDLTLLWQVLRIGALILLAAALLLGPFVTIVAAKALRRRSRRAEPDPASRIAAGWEEYVDAAVDRGFTAPPVLTRSELALRMVDAGAPASTQVGTLAVLADRAVFAPDTPPEADVTEFWRMVEAERGILADGVGTWQRLRAAVSLRSFARYLTPSKAGRARATGWLHERRKRAR